MPKRVHLKNDLATTDAQEARTRYEGETPPAGVYRCRIQRVTLKKNKNNDPMFTIGFVIDHDPDAPKAKFNGYYRQANLTMNKVWMSQARQFADSVGITPAEMNGPLLDDDGERVLQWGPRDVTSLRARVSFLNATYQGERVLDAKDYLPDDGETHEPVPASKGGAKRSTDDDASADDVWGDDAGDGDVTAAADADGSTEDDPW